MTRLAGKTAWITGAGSGIGEAAAHALAAEGATVILTGRRREELDRVAADIARAGNTAHPSPADITDSDAIQAIADRARSDFGGIDILVNNAGSNVRERTFAELTPANVDLVIATNLNAAFHCATAVLPGMRAGGGGLLIHTASWAGRFPGRLSGAVYSAAKQAMLAMSQILNEEEYVHGIRSCALCPAEVATPILDRRPVPVSQEDRARMLQPADLGDLIRYVATLPPHVCVNEILISPTHNRLFARP
jgi:NADP-dependent 3-hydroxy acid dehydrogenase YdfG